jgi:hypothetical protein
MVPCYLAVFLVWWFALGGELDPTLELPVPSKLSKVC